MARRPFQSGRSTVTRRSKRPGRSSALSRPSGRLVAAITTTAWRVSKPSISTSNWLRVCSRSSLLLILAPRWRPTASISSIKMMLGEAFLACSNRSRTRLAPTPTSTSTNSEPLIEKKHSSRYLAVQSLEFARRLQELNYLLQFVLRLVDARHVSKGRAGPILENQFGLALAEAEDALLPLRGAPTEKEKQTNQKHPG